MSTSTPSPTSSHRGWPCSGERRHGLKNHAGDQSPKGSNPFGGVNRGGQKLSSVVKAYDPPYNASTNVYDYIKSNIAGWVDEAIKIRNKF
jgi:hypothetical protein